MKSVKILLILFLMSINLNLIGQNKNESTIKNNINNYLESGTEQGFSGAITVVQNGKILINKGYGLANKNTQSYNSPSTVFDIGSNTKQFTATAILKLVEMGKLKLEDSINIYFKDVPEDKQGITIHQLLSNTSGLEDSIGRDFNEITEDEFFKQLFSSKLLSEPGSKYSYSNIGYSMLGRIIEIVSKEKYEVFLSKHLFAPAGMHETGYLLPKWDPSTLSRSYNRGILDGESPVLKYQRNGEISWHLKANGGINSTQNDMILWYRAMKSNRILSKESFKILTTAYAEYPGGKLSYGYGWTVKQYNKDLKRIAHNGSNGAYAHSLILFLEKDIYISYATNANSEKVEYIAYEIAKMLLDEAYIPKPIKNNVYGFAIDFIRKNNRDRSGKLIRLLKENYSENFTNSRLLNSIGNILLMMNEQQDWAVEIFKHNIKLYPNDGNLWDSLGDGYRAVNNNTKAKKSYQKAIELGYTGSVQKLQELNRN